MSNIPDPPIVNLADPDAAKRWAADLRAQINDVIAAGRDATAPPASRDLGRRLARAQINDAADSIEALFTAAGLAVAEASRPDLKPRTIAASPSAEREREMYDVRNAPLDIADAQDDAQRADILESMPIAGVLFLALVGTPGERVAIDPPLVLALRAVLDTVEGWARVRSGSTILASIPYADLDLLSRRIEATIEIARRGGAARASKTAEDRGTT